MTETRRSENLWEHTWKTRMPLNEPPWVRTFRVVGWYLPGGGGALFCLQYEELTTDAMGHPSWQPTQDESVPQEAMARLLQLAGKLPAYADLSEL